VGKVIPGDQGEAAAARSTRNITSYDDPKDRKQSRKGREEGANAKSLRKKVVTGRYSEEKASIRELVSSYESHDIEGRKTEKKGDNAWILTLRSLRRGGKRRDRSQSFIRGEGVKLAEKC